MAKLNVDVVIKGIDGKPIKERKTESKGEKNLTFRVVARESLLVLEDKMNGEDKYERFKIAGLIEKGGDVTLTAEQMAIVKEAIGKYQYPVVVGAAWDHIEGIKKD